MADKLLYNLVHLFEWPATAVTKTSNYEDTWRISMPSSGGSIAVVQEAAIEIRNTVDFTLERTIPVENLSSHRCICWSQDGSVVAALIGSQLSIVTNSIVVQSNLTQTDENFGVEIFFIESRKPGFARELVVVWSDGLVQSYLVDGGVELFSQLKICSKVSSVCFDSQTRTMVVGQHCKFQNRTEYYENGLLKIELLSHHPYYQRLDNKSTTISTTIENFQRSRWIYPVLTMINFFPVCKMHRMKISPDRTHLASCDTEGRIYLWGFPSLGFKLTHPPKAVGDVLGVDEGCLEITTMDWWSNDHLVVSTSSGYLSIFNIHDLDPLIEPEGFSPIHQTTPVSNHSFLVLECKEEIHNTGTNDNDPFLKNNGNRLSIASYSPLNFWKSKEKKYSCDLQRQICCFTKTTPEKLFAQKLKGKEYGEALVLAGVYNFNPDQVYQQQWMESDVSAISIQDHLSKVKDYLWVVHEICRRTPPTLDGAMELYKFGLAVTDAEQLASNFDRLTPGGWKLSETSYDYEELYCHPSEELDAIRSEYEGGWLDRVDFDRLTFQQSEVVRCRRKILSFFDKLFTYQELLGGYDATRDRYSAEEFSKFCENNLLDTALDYARMGNWGAVQILLRYHSTELGQHWLPLLSNLPDTLPPKFFQDLLPHLEDGVVVPPPTSTHRFLMDWCEKQDSIEQDDVAFYSSNPGLLQFRRNPVDRTSASDWFIVRSKQLETEGCQLDHALSLLNLGLKLGFVELHSLHLSLEVLHHLVFECGSDLSMSLTTLLSMDPGDLVELMLQNSTEDSFMADVRRWVLPYVDGLEQKSLVAEYLVGNPRLKVLLNMLKQVFNENEFEKFFESRRSLVEVVIESISNAGGNDVEIALDLVEICSVKIPEAETELDEMRRILKSLKILSKHCPNLSPSRLSEVHGDHISMLFQAFYRQSALSLVDPTSAKCREILRRGSQVRAAIFSGEFPESKLLEVFVRALLSTAVKSVIVIAGEFLSKSEVERPTEVKLPYKESVALVHAAGQEYLDSASTDDDPMLGLSKLCLGLIPGNPPPIQHLLDLIEAVTLIRQLGVVIVPVKIRLCTNRLELIKQVLAQPNRMYLKVEQIQRLGRLLSAGREDLNDEVNLLVIEQALQHNDYCLAKELVTFLMSKNFDRVWKFAYELALCTEVDPLFRYDCLSFAASYCSNNELDDITVAIMSYMKEQPELLQPTPIIPSDTQCMSWPEFDQIHRNNISTKVQNLPEFYQSIVEGGCGKTVDHYVGYHGNPFVSNLGLVFGKYDSNEIIEILLKSDFSLALFHFLGNMGVNIPSTTEFALYAHSLQVCLDIGATLQDHICPIYQAPPAYLSRLATQLKGDSPNQVKLQQIYRDYLEYYKVLKVTSSSTGIDVERFKSDVEYKRSSVYGLAMTDDMEQLLVAIAVAKLEGWGVWGVISAHVEFMFTESMVYHPGVMLGRLDELEMLGELRLHAEEFFHRMDTNIFPLINDHEKLIDYFKLLQSCGLESNKGTQHNQREIPITLHLRILHLTRHLNVDYKELIRGDSPELIETWGPVMSEQNLSDISEILPQICPEVTKSGVVAWWVGVFFWLEVDVWNWAKCARRFKQCQKWLDDLDSVDLLEFVRNVLFSKTSVETLDPTLREKLSVSCHKYVAGRLKKAKDRTQQTQLDELCVEIHRMNDHLHLQLTPPFVKFLQNFQSNELRSTFISTFDAAVIQKSDLYEVCIELLKESSQLTQQFIEIIPNMELDFRQIVSRCVDQVSRDPREFPTLAKIVGSMGPGDLGVVSDVFGVALNSKVDFGVKVQLLELLDEHHTLKPDEVQKLVYYRTLQRIKEGWGESMVGLFQDSSDFRSVEMFTSLVERLLGGSTTVGQLQLLLEVVSESGQCQGLLHHKRKVLIELLEKVVEGGGDVSRFALHYDVTIEIVELVVEILTKHNQRVSALKLILRSEKKVLFPKISEIIKSVTKLNEHDFDDDLALLLLQTSQVPLTLGTPYFYQVIKFAVDKDAVVSQPAIYKLMSQLQRNGFVVESSVLLQRYFGGHPSFLTFGCSIDLVAAWNTGE